MIKTVVAAAVVGVILYGQGAFAETLEDILKEKGVISEEDYEKVTSSQRAVTSSQPLAYVLGNGFTFTSADKKYQGSIGGFMQLRYTYTDLDNANNNKTKITQDSSQFQLERVKLYFNGYALTPDLTYKLQLNITQANTPNILSTGKEIEEAYIDYRIIDAVQIRFGQDKVPFARQFIISSAAQEFCDLSHVATAFAPGYDFGAMLHGKIAGGLVTYNAGVFGGNGQGDVQVSTDTAIAARIAVNPLGEMKYVEADVDYSEKPLASFGVNYYGDTVMNNSTTTNLNLFSSTGWIGIGSPLMSGAAKFSSTEKLNINSVGFDSAFEWRGLYAQGEYFFGQADGKTTNNTLRSQGFYAQAGYFVIPKILEVAARYAYLDPDRDVTNDHWVESTGAVSWYINNHFLKIQADFTDIHKQAAIAFNSGPKATNDDRFRLQAQIMF
jgi:phosphate-selective porin OprO/OprP